jgi:metal-sulfur cluster biosynthetic enzyme
LLLEPFSFPRTWSLKPHRSVAFIMTDDTPPGGDDLELEQGPLTEDQVRLALRRVKDPEIGLNIVDLGLVYDVSLDGADVTVDMSLTSPGCPAGPQILHEAEEQLRSMQGVGGVAVNLVWSPPWTPERIEPRVRAYLGF